MRYYKGKDKLKKVLNYLAKKPSPLEIKDKSENTQ